MIGAMYQLGNIVLYLINLSTSAFQIWSDPIHQTCRTKDCFICTKLFQGNQNNKVKQINWQTLQKLESEDRVKLEEMLRSNCAETDDLTIFHKV